MPDYLPKAILLDLDDTILAGSGALSMDAWAETCNRFAGRFDGVEPGTLLSAIEEYRGWYWGDSERHRTARLNMPLARREVVAGALERLGIVAPELAVEIGDFYAAHSDGLVHPFPGAIDTLQTLLEYGVRLALITNGMAGHQRAKVDRFDLARFFDCVLIEGEFGVGKPDDRVYAHALGRLDAHPEQTWMVGDNLEWEVATPQRLGMTGIWVDSAGAGLPESSTVRPDRTIRSLPELLEGPAV